IVIETIGREIAAVLGHATSAGFDPERPLKDLGLDSLMAVELRNRLSAVTGLRLPAPLLFDHPTPKALAAFLRAELEGEAAPIELRPVQRAEPPTATPEREKEIDTMDIDDLVKLALNDA